MTQMIEVLERRLEHAERAAQKFYDLVQELSSVKGENDELLGLLRKAEDERDEWQRQYSECSEACDSAKAERDEARDDVKALVRLLDAIVDSCKQERDSARKKAKQYALEAKITSMAEKRADSRESERAWICQGFGVEACELAIFYAMKDSALSRIRAALGEGA
jgi:peptidoglycan hydrolase CwlO-like protein